MPGQQLEIKILYLPQIDRKRQVRQDVHRVLESFQGGERSFGRERRSQALEGLAVGEFQRRRFQGHAFQAGRFQEAEEYMRRHAHAIAALPVLQMMTEQLSEFRRLRRGREARGEAPPEGEGLYLTRGIRDVLRAREAMRRQIQEQAPPRGLSAERR